MAGGGFLDLGVEGNHRLINKLAERLSELALEGRRCGVLHRFGQDKADDVKRIVVKVLSEQLDGVVQSPKPGDGINATIDRDKHIRYGLQNVHRH